MRRNLIIASICYLSCLSAGTVSGTFSHYNYGADGRINGLLLSPSTLVYLPAEWAGTLELCLHPGDAVSVTGTEAAGPTGLHIVEPVTLTVAGKTLSVISSTRPKTFSGTGVIQQLNYNSQGEVDGFVLENGMLAQSREFKKSDLALLKPGVTVGVGGFASVTPSGRTVLELQSMTVNGQTVNADATLAKTEPGPAPRP